MRLAASPVPVFSSSLAYYDGLRRKRVAAALFQGQRDLFGAHTYGRVDAEGAAPLEADNASITAVALYPGSPWARIRAL